MENCYICTLPSTKYKANLNLCEKCILDYKELLLYSNDTDNIKRKFKLYRKKMQHIYETLNLKNDDILAASWKIFCFAFSKRFLIGRRYDTVAYLSIIASARIHGIILMPDDVTKKEPLSFKKYFKKRYVKNIQSFLEILKTEMDISWKASVKMYMDVLLRKLQTSEENKKKLLSIADKFDKLKLYNNTYNINVDGTNMKSKPELHVIAAVIFYVVVKCTQQEVADAVYISPIPIQRYHKSIQSIIDA